MEREGRKAIRRTCSTAGCTHFSNEVLHNNHGHSFMTDIRIVTTNTSLHGGTFLTPLWFAAHDGSFDLYTNGEAASAGLEALAEDGNFTPINEEVLAADADAVTGAVLGAAGPIATGETASSTVSLNGSATSHISLSAMILPSNDAFIGTESAIRLFDEDGNFLGAQNIRFDGADVLDAGTEENTEEDAAFLNQTAANTGVDENGVVHEHPGFLDDGNILGGTNAAGAFIDPEAADFTQPGAQIADVHINTVETFEGSRGSDVLIGSASDDLANGGRGQDALLGRLGWDELSGNAGRDYLDGGKGNDTLDGGRGNDVLLGGQGADVFVFEQGDKRDRIQDFNADEDVLTLSIEGIESLDDLTDLAEQRGQNTVIDFGEGDVLVLRGLELDSLTDLNVDFF